jgi:hypothetical protein
MATTQSYELVRLDDEDGIRCLYCGLISYNPNDIAHHYCGNCHVWHDDPDEVKQAARTQAHGETFTEPNI